LLVINFPIVQHDSLTILIMVCHTHTHHVIIPVVTLKDAANDVIKQISAYTVE